MQLTTVEKIQIMLLNSATRLNLLTIVISGYHFDSVQLQIICVSQVVQDGHSVLIFCSSRRGCESTAKHVSKFLKKFSTNIHSSDGEVIDINSATDALQRCPAGLDPVLEETLPSGVAYHHAGLTVSFIFLLFFPLYHAYYFVG